MTLLQRSVSLHAAIDEGFDVLDGHAAGFQAFNNGKPAEVGIFKAADTLVVSFDERQQTFLFIVAQCVRGQMHFLRRFADGVEHKKFSSFAIKKVLT